jgi:hypothetical protein
MRDVEQYEFAEIAQILQMNETAISSFQEQENNKENIAKFTVMELNKIEIVVKKYFDGETSVEEKRVTNTLLQLTWRLI